jgi:DNA-binding transcriptional LysR family regulator
VPRGATRARLLVVHRDPLLNLDLNLLVVLDALLESCSVTVAARDLGRSQSAVSHALSRLRERLNDPILVRVGPRMEPTDRALQLRSPLRGLLQGMADLIQPKRDFDPATSTARLKLYTSDYVGLVVLPRLYARIRRLAPRVNMQVLRIDRAWPRYLQEGRAHAAMTPIAPELEQGLRGRTLFSDRFVTLAPPEMVRPDGTVGMAEFVARPHVLVSPEGGTGSSVQLALNPHGRTRRIALDQPYFLGAVAAAAAARDFITLPSRLAELLDKHDLQPVEPPIYMVPFSVRMVWHLRVHDDPAARWFRDQIKAVTDALSLGPDVPAGATPTTPN